MDLNLIASAQHLSDNQLGFDQEELDRAILRSERRQAFLRAVWSRRRVPFKIISGYLSLVNRLAMSRLAG